MKFRVPYPALICVVWLLCLLAIPFWIAGDGIIAWDYSVLRNAMQALHAGQDPYLTGIAAQDAYRQSPELQAHELAPVIYVYSPVTLPLLRFLSAQPPTAVAATYWSIYALLVVVQLLVSTRLAAPRERRIVLLFAPMAVFFPGLLIFDSVLGGNIAFLLFGLIFFAAWMGWERGRWLFFYAAVVLAAFCKIPYLSLLAIPLLAGRRQWLPAVTAAFAGLGAYALQYLVWPVSFHNYLLAVDRIFSFNNDFGSSPAGRFGAALAALGLPYSLPGTIFFLATALPLFLVLLRLSRRYRQGALSREQWLPVMLLGVLLLNPRLNEYEIFPFSIAMALIASRLVRAARRPWLAAAVVLPLWGAMNYFANASRICWKNLECAVLVALIVGGCWQLLRLAKTAFQPTSESPLAETASVPALKGV